MGNLRIHLLGPIRVVTDDGRAVTPPGKRGQALLAMLALSDRRCRSRAWLQSKLWSEREAAQGSASLRQELLRLRRVIGSYHVVTDQRDVRLEAAWVDVVDIVATGTMPPGFTAAEVPDLLEGLDIPDEEFEEWLRLERVHWRDRIEAVWQSSVNDHAAEPLPRRPFGIAAGTVIAAPLQRLARRPAIGLMPCVVDTSQPHCSAGDLLCDMAASLMVENGNFAVFDFRDLSGRYAANGERGNPPEGPDLLMMVRLRSLANLLEIGFAIRRVADGQIIWTQSLAADAIEPVMIDERRIAEFVNQAVDAAETWLARTPPSDAHDASRLTLAAAHHIMSLSADDMALAETNLDLAQELEPSAVRLAWMAILETIRLGESAGRDRQEQVERVRALTASALALDRTNSLALALLGHANAYVVGDFDMAEELIGTALEINPSRAAAWDARAMLDLYTGEIERGSNAARRAKALGRFSPYAFWYEASCGIAATLAGDHARAIRHHELVLRQRPDFQPTIRHLAASYALSGGVQQARCLFGRLKALEPDFSAAQLRDPLYPTASRRSVALIEAGLKAAEVDL